MHVGSGAVEQADDVVSMCHTSLVCVARRPTCGLGAWTRSLGRRQPNRRTRRYQVDGGGPHAAQALGQHRKRTRRAPVRRGPPRPDSRRPSPVRRATRERSSEGHRVPLRRRHRRCGEPDLVVGGHSVAAGGSCSAYRRSSPGSLMSFSSAQRVHGALRYRCHGCRDR